MPFFLALVLSLTVTPLRLDRARHGALLSFEATDDTARIEKQLASLALSWVSERQTGCTAFLDAPTDPARLSAELFGELLHPRFASPRAAQWALWRAVALELHHARFEPGEAAVARAWDDAFARLVEAGDPDAERAALAAIASWDRVVASD